MTTTFTRSAIRFWSGVEPPADLAFVIDGRVITWEEVLRNRRERQALILERKRQVNCFKPFKVWVAYFDQWCFGGWQAFIENRDGCAWIDRDRRFLKEPLMRLFPLVLPFADGDRWSQWKVEFARRHRRRTHHRKPLGVSFVWWRGGHDMHRTHPRGRNSA